jgi:hypothetical protein
MLCTVIIRKLSVLAEIQTKHVLTTSLECFLYAILFHVTQYSSRVICGRCNDQDKEEGDMRITKTHQTSHTRLLTMADYQKREIACK